MADLAERLRELDLSGIALITGPDGVEFEECFGLADRAAGIPVTPATRFGLASVTKMFTAVTVATLGVDVAAPVVALLPPDRRPSTLRPDVTVHHLLSHTSGIADYCEEDESLLTISTTHTFANTWLAWRLGAFQMEHPDLAVRMSTSNEVIDLRSGETDIAIRAGKGDWDGLEKHKLFDVDFMPMASPCCMSEARKQFGPDLKPADLLHLPLISPQDSWWEQWFKDWGVETEGRPQQRGGLRLDNQANEGHAAMGGQGFALMSPFLWVNDIIQERLLVPFPGMISKRGWSYWLVYPSERRLLPKIKRFREWLGAEMDKAHVQEQGLMAQLQATAGDNRKVA